MTILFISDDITIQLFVMASSQEKELLVQTSEADAEFSSWLEKVVSQFSKLEPEQQTVALNQLISCCGSQQLWHLQQKLPDFLYRDFIK